MRRGRACELGLCCCLPWRESPITMGKRIRPHQCDVVPHSVIFTAVRKHGSTIRFCQQPFEKNRLLVGNAEIIVHTAFAPNNSCAPHHTVFRHDVSWRRHLGAHVLNTQNGGFKPRRHQPNRAPSCLYLQQPSAFPGPAQLSLHTPLFSTRPLPPALCGLPPPESTFTCRIVRTWIL